MATALTTDRIPLKRRRAQQSRARQLMTMGSDKVSMENYEGVIYFADITIGSATYVVVVDTGSSDLWVSCSVVSGQTCVTTCPTTATTITYGSGSVCVESTTNTVTFGSVTVNNYVVGIAEGDDVIASQSSSSLLTGDAQGLLGLAYASLAALPSSGGQLIDHMTSFSIYLTAQDNADGSFLLINSVDETFISEQNMTGFTVGLKTAQHWTIGMTGLKIGNETAVFPCTYGSSGSCSAIVDTGSSLLAMPSALFRSFVNTYLTPNNCILYSSSGIYLCPSSVSLPTLAMSFGETATFYLKGSDYTMDAGMNYVYVELQATSGSFADMWILGDTFLKTYYTKYTVDESITFYCNNGNCEEGGTVLASSNSGSSGNGFGGTNNGGNGIGGSSSISSGTGFSSDDLKLMLIIVFGVLGGCLVIGFLRSCCRRRRQPPPPPAVTAQPMYAVNDAGVVVQLPEYYSAVTPSDRQFYQQQLQQQQQQQQQYQPYNQRV